VDSYPGNEFKGAVSTVGPMAVSTGEVFPLEISLANDKNLMPGLSAHSALIARATGIVVPQSAVQHADNRSLVFVVQDNKAYQREVTAGLRSDREIVIVTGLSEGERVAISNVGQLTDGQEINAK